MRLLLWQPKWLLWQPKWRLECIKRRYSVKTLKNPKITQISRKMRPLPWQSKWRLNEVYRTGSHDTIPVLYDSVASNDMTTWTGRRKIRYFTTPWTWTLDMATSEKSTLVEVDPDPSVAISEEDESETRTSPRPSAGSLLDKLRPPQLTPVITEKETIELVGPKSSQLTPKPPKMRKKCCKYPKCEKIDANTQNAKKFQNILWASLSPYW